MQRQGSLLLSALLVVCAAGPLPVAAGVIVEPFDVATSDVTDGSYPAFTLTAGTGAVTGGVLRLDGQPGTGLQRFTRSGFSGDLTISGQIKAATFGVWNVGIEFGNRRFIFHPGYNGLLDDGAFRIEQAASLGTLVPNQDMGFVPSVNVFHEMELAWSSAANLITVTIKDGTGVAPDFVYAWTPDAGFNPFGSIGFTAAGSANKAFGPSFFDNLSISGDQVLAVPLPATVTLVLAGLGVLAGTRRREPRVPAI